MSPILVLLLQTVVIVAVARALGVIFRALGQPRVVGEMVAGLLLGPSLFGRVAPAATAWLFPASSLDLLNAFSQFGLVLFMLLVGIRLNEGHLRANARAVLTTGYVSILLPFALGAAYAFAVSERFGIAPPSVLPFVGFIGLSLSVTAFPVLARILDEHGLAGTRLGAVATACAAMSDIVAWIALALLTSIVSTGNVAVGGPLVGLAVYGVAMLTVVRPLLRRLLARTGTDEGMAMVLVAALGSAAATEAVGIHPLFGSFFLGALMSRDIRNQAAYAERVEPLTTTLLLPLFFAFTGLRTDIFLLTSPGLVLEALLVLAIAVVGKALWPLVAARRLGFSRQEAAGLAALLNTRGLVELVVLNIGLEIGLLPPPLFTMLVMMALVTTTITSPILTRLGYVSVVAGARGVEGGRRDGA